jgi:hypothetical protein
VPRKLKVKQSPLQWAAQRACERSSCGLTPPSSGRPTACFACLRSPLMSNVRFLLVGQRQCNSSRVQPAPRAAARTVARARSAVGCLRGAELCLFGGQRSIGLAARGPSAQRRQAAKRCLGPAPVLWQWRCLGAKVLVLRRRLRSAHARRAAALRRGLEFSSCGGRWQGAAPKCPSLSRAANTELVPFASSRRGTCRRAASAASVVASVCFQNTGHARSAT